MRRLALYAVAWLCLAQCATGVPGIGDEIYACKTTADCLESYECIGGRCRPKGTPLCLAVDCTDPGCAGKTCAPNGQVCVGRICGCSGNGGTAQAQETSCGDNADNDCDGLVDCQDDACAGLSCGGGGTCIGTLCACPASGNAPQAVETLCSDGLDNDCDGLIDCNDPSCGTLGCGANGLVCIADAGACQCGGNGGVREGSESICGDLADNDCDGATDCADATCDLAACNAFGSFCTALKCTCSGNGGVAEQNGELSCTDGHDNDCDGLTDCADPSCDTVSCGVGCTCLMGAKRETACTDTMDNDNDTATDCADSDCDGVACGMFGLTCSGGMCRCVVDGGTVQAMETNCADGKDNDCDGLTDCGEAVCAGQSCGGAGRVCVGTVCTCFLDGGVSEPTEVSCFDGKDNDCDGLTDCVDPNCAMASCGTGCACVGGVKAETACNDGIDNDGDGMTDCVDAQCSHKQCGATAASVCCGATCRNLGTDPLNCGGCGLTCTTGTCNAVSAGGIPTGRCQCNGNGQCPSGQNCNGGSCSCNAASDCAAGESCGSSACHY